MVLRNAHGTELPILSNTVQEPFTLWVELRA